MATTSTRPIPDIQPACYQHNATLTLNPFQHLILEIKKYLGVSGIGSEDVDVDYLRSLMTNYVSNPNDWQQYARMDQGKHYTRNYVESINGKANILILVWNPNRGSPVHDHANAHCIMKVLQGSLKEEIFHPPDMVSQSDAPLQPIKTTLYSADEVTYICDNIGLHRISNPSDKAELAVSLHLYTPPHAADYGYHIYEEATGRHHYVKTSK